MKKYLLLLLFIYLSLSINAQPTNNIITSFYNNKSGDHWTESLSWGNVTNVQNTEAVTQNNSFCKEKWESVCTSDKPKYVVDSASLASVLSNISKSNNGKGGVLYFPAGIYIFDFDVYLPSNVILRGKKPQTSKTNAKKNNFSPPAIFLFPKYIPEYSGDGTPVKSAFKHIHGVSSCDNAGLAWLTINRAVINFLPKPEEWKKTITESDEAPYNGTYDTPQPSKIMTNIFVFGVRTTNAIEAEKSIPDDKMHPWQRWPNRRIGNINAFIYKNGFFSNNRLNDVEECANFKDGYPHNGDYYHTSAMGDEAKESYTNTTYPIESDDFIMPTYKISDGTEFDSVTFGYNYHYGMNINRGKLAYYPKDHMTNWFGTQWHYNPTTEPASMGTNMEIMDNWVFKTMRPAFQVGGYGCIVRDNICRDWKEKQKSENQQKVSPAGNKEADAQFTYENRGIDISGWNCLVDSNWIETYQMKIGSYSSTDGEGILHQESSGSSIRGLKIKDNVSFDYIGLYKSKDMYDVEVTGNIVHDEYIMVQADHNNGTASLYNVEVSDNKTDGEIIVRGTCEGNNVIAKSNEASSYNFTCYVEETNNKGGDITWYKDGLCDCKSQCLKEVSDPCNTSINFPSVNITSHKADSTYNVKLNDEVNLSYQCSREDNPSDFSYWTYSLFINTDTVHGNVNPDGSITHNMKLNDYNTYNVTLRVNDTSHITYSSPVSFKVKEVLNVSSFNNVNNADFSVFPNPAKNKLSIKVNQQLKGGVISLINMQGQTVNSISKAKKFNNMVVNSLKPGIYFLKVQKGKYKASKHVIIK